MSGLSMSADASRDTPRVVLTQSDGRLEGLASGLAERGWDVIRHPLIETRPRLDAATRSHAADLLELSWLLFTSRSAVEAWEELELPFTGPRFGAVGEKTAKTLAAAGAEVSLVASPATAEGLAASFTAREDAEGPVGVPQGDRARPALQAALERAGFPVRTVVVYETHGRRWTVEVHVDAIVLASPSAVRSLPDDVAGRARLVTLGPTTSRAVRDRGFRAFEAATPSVEAVLDVLAHGVPEQDAPEQVLEEQVHSRPEPPPRSSPT